MGFFGNDIENARFGLRCGNALILSRASPQSEMKLMYLFYLRMAEREMQNGCILLKLNGICRLKVIKRRKNIDII